MAGPRRGMPVPKGAIKKGTMKRLLKYVFHYYKWHLIVVYAKKYRRSDHAGRKIRL